MQKLQLYISGTRVDLFKDESVSMTQTIQNVKDISKIFTEFTQSFTVPASKINNILFKHYYNFDIAVNSFDARNKVSAEIQLNFTPFKKGYIRLEGVELKKNKAYAYKITFFGETINLKDVLEDDELSALDGLNSENLDYTATNIRSNLIGSVDALITPLITHTTQLYYDSSLTGTDGNLYYSSGVLQGVYWKELKFALRLYEIIEAIQTKYSITFSDDFFNDVTNLSFYNLYMWLHRKKGDVEPAQQVELVYNQIPSFTASGSTETSDLNGAIVVPSSLVTYPASINTFTLSLTPTTPAEYNIKVFRNGSLYYQRLAVTSGQTITHANFTMTAGSYTVSVASSAGVTFNSAQITWEIAGSFGGEAIPAGWTDNYSSTSGLTTNTTFEFIITEQIPKMKIIDFLSAIFKMFNLTAYVDETGTIVVRTLDSYYAASSVVWDINEYVDIDKSSVNIALPFKEIEFAYKGLGTFLSKQFEQLENTGWGTLSYSLDNAKYDAPQSSYKLSIPFEHLQYQRLVNANGGGSTDIQWGWCVDDSKAAYYGLPIIFYAIKETLGTAISFLNTTSTHTSERTYIIPSNSRALASSTSTENINFQLEINEYTDGSTFTGTLFENYYKTYIVDVFNNKRRITKVNARLPLKMIYNLKLNDKISLNNYTYRINSLKTDLTTGKSSLELLNIV
jgi:hypothetical protein